MTDIDVFQTVTSVSFQVEPNTNVININKVTVEAGGLQDLQSVTNVGATTTNGISINTGSAESGISSTSLGGYGVYGESSETYGVYGTSTSLAGVYGNSNNYGIQGESSNIGVYGNSTDTTGVYGNSLNGTGVQGYSENGTGVYGNSDNGTGLSAYSSSGIGLEVYGNGTVAIDCNLGNTNKGLVLDSGASSTGNPIEVIKDGVTKFVVNQEGSVTANQVKFNTTPTEPATATVGSLIWNDTAGTLDLKLKGGNTTLQIGQETVARIVNRTATNITLLEENYQVVRVTGAQGQRPKVDLALANNDLNSTTTLGLVTETILNNQEGFVTTSGQVQEINTTGSLQGETWLDGDMLYLSGTVAGRLTNIKPVAPTHTVIIGFVEYAHAVHGKIFVKVDNGYELDELHNVSAIAPNNNEVLTYDTPTLLWKAKPISTALGFTVENIANKSQDLEADKLSVVKYPSVKALYDSLKNKKILKYTSESSLPITGDLFTVYFLTVSNVKYLKYWNGTIYINAILISDFFRDYYAKKADINLSNYLGVCRNIAVIEDEDNGGTFTHYFYNGTELQWIVSINQ